MDVHVVDEGVGQPVGRDPDADRHEVGPARGVETDPQAEAHDGGEHHRVGVVGLEAAVATSVVAAVQPHADAVHHEAVGQRGHRLHRRERDDQQDQRSHAVMLRLMRWTDRVAGRSSRSRSTSPLARGGSTPYDARVRSRVLGATVGTSAALVLIVGACSNDDDGTADATLPAIQTTTSITTTIPPTTSQPRFYEIQSGDTLIEIAAAFGLPVQAVMEANGITDANVIFAGQIITLPLASEIVVTSLPPITTLPQATALPVVTEPTP